MFALDAAPHSWLFPRCAAVIHHGGSGTTHEGLRWGRPSIVCPIGVDQPFWGRRVAEAGAGPAPVGLADLSPARLAEALRFALSAECRARSGQLGAAIRREDGAGTAAQWLCDHVLRATYS